MIDLQASNIFEDSFVVNGDVSFIRGSVIVGNVVHKGTASKIRNI
jgi:hypothetical protein